MSTYEPQPQEGTDTELTHFDGRPDDCDCLPSFDDLSCWPCYRDGFVTPNPNASAE